MSVNDIITSSQGNNINLLRQLPFYGKTIKPRIKKFTDAKLLSELPFFKKPIKAKMKQLTTKKLLQEQPFYKQPIKKPRTKKLSNYELLRDLPFYDDINISRKERALRGYAETYKVEIMNNKNLSDSLSVSKNSIKNLFDELLREKKDFKYIISAKITLEKRINDNEFDPKTLHFNSLIKTVINQRYRLNDSFKEILNLLDIWINEGSGWIIDEIKGLYINISNYEPLLGGSYIPLPKALNNSLKGLINLKTRDDKCFMWCHVRIINPQNRNAERINKQDKKIAANLNYSDIVFQLDINDYKKIEDRFQMQVNVFGYENKVYPLYISKKSYNQTINLLLITEKDKSHYVFIKDFNRLMFSRTKNTIACLVYKVLLQKKYYLITKNNVY